MRLITHLAKRETKDDTFGMKDEDWNVYKAISKVFVLFVLSMLLCKHAEIVVYPFRYTTSSKSTLFQEAGGSDSEEDDYKLQDIEVVLKKNCPDFLGVGPNGDSKATRQEDYQILLGTEKVKSPGPTGQAQARPPSVYENGLFE